MSKKSRRKARMLINSSKYVKRYVRKMMKRAARMARKCPTIAPRPQPTETLDAASWLFLGAYTAALSKEEARREQEKQTEG